MKALKLYSDSDYRYNSFVIQKFLLRLFFLVKYFNCILIMGFVQFEIFNQNFIFKFISLI